jgi:hypothetical protein
MASSPLTEEVASALARFFADGRGPSHLEIDEVLRTGGIGALDPKTGSTEPVGKEVRVRGALGGAARSDDVDGEAVVGDLLARMRVRGCFDPATTDQFGGEQCIRAAVRAFGTAGWAMDDSGHISPAVLPDVTDPGIRPALDLTIARLRRAGTDSALLIGEAKSLVESTAKYVLQELQFPSSGYQDFNQLLHFARERIGLLPDNLDATNVVGKQLKRVYGGLGSIVSALGELRNTPEGTGHGHSSVPGLDNETAIAVVQAAAVLSGLMLRALDRQLGNG